MGLRLKRRLRELESIALDAQKAAAHSAASANEERTRAAERELALRQQAESENQTLRKAFDEALERAGVVLFQKRANTDDCFYVSTSVRAVLGWSPSSFLRPGALRGIVHPDDLRVFDKLMTAPELDATDSTDGPAVPTPVRHSFDGTPPFVLNLNSAHNDSADADGTPRTGREPRPEPLIRFRSADGTWARLALRPDALSGGSHTETSGALITVEHARDALAVSEWFTKLVENDPSGTLILDFTDSSDPLSLVIRAANATARRAFNIDSDLNRNIALDELLGGSSAQLVRSAVFDVYHTGETVTVERLTFSEIPTVHFDMRVVRLDDGAIGVVFEDVTAMVSVETRLRKQASHDALTGLPSRTLLEERLEVATSRATLEAPVGLMLVDIADLGAINENYGLNFGDEVLKQVGNRLVRRGSGVSVVARFGDDEFALVLSTSGSPDRDVALANSVSTELRQPFDIHGHMLEVGFSIGMAVAPANGDDARTLLRNASTALRDAKTSGTDVVLYRDNDVEPTRGLPVLNVLRQSLDDNLLELRFQPQLDLRSGRVRKVEAVPRWTDDQDPARMSVELLEMAEQSALIQPLTRWMLSESAKASRQLQSQNREWFHAVEPIVVAIDLASRNLFDPELEEIILRMIETGEFEPGLIELEVNEPGLMDDPSASQETLERLSGLGVNFVVDEFGTGYTSLSTMRHLAVRGLKIDRSYLASIATVPSDAAVIRSTIDLSHELGLFAAATGVTDIDVLRMLVEFGCDFAQGPFLSEPVSLADLPARIAELEETARGWLGAQIAS